MNHGLIGKRMVAMMLMIGAFSAFQTQAQQRCNPNIIATTPTTDFVLHGDGTVTHTPTGLMWARCVQGNTGEQCEAGTAITATWQDALAIAQAEVFAGHSDWRLPNSKELMSITELSCVDPALNSEIFPTENGELWSNTPAVVVNGIQSITRTWSGGEILSIEGRTTVLNFRLVRDANP